MTAWFSKSLMRKLSLIMLVSILVPLLSLGIFSYLTASDLAEEQAKLTGSNILKQLDTNLEFIMKDIQNQSLFLIGSKDVQAYLNNSALDALKMQTRMIEFLSNLVFFKPYIADITIYPKSGAPQASSTTFFGTELPDVLAEHGQYSADHPYDWTRRYETVTDAGKKRVISLIRPVRNTYSYKEIGTLVISMDEKAIGRILSEAGAGGESDLLLVDAEGRILSGSRPSVPERIDALLPGLRLPGEASGSLNHGSGKDKRTVLYLTVPGVDWKLVEVIPFSVYKAQNRYVLALTAVAVGLSLFIVIALVIYFVRRLTKPLRMLTVFLKDTDPEKPMVTYPVESMDEVGQLVRSYNKLSDRIGLLTEQVKLNEAMKTEADMQALQAQINPHFLYNTLSSIHWMALMNKDKNTADMVGNLSDFLRFSLNKGAQYCLLEQEVDHARHYANIQAIRYPDKFDILFAIDPELNRYAMLKLLLQPLIENALAHGIQKQPGKGSISVNATKQGGTIRFSVEDTGVGIVPDKLADIRAALSRSDEQDDVPQGSYGLRNVNRRLLLHYGINAGLVVESVVGAGTRVSFTIPVSEESA
ncbi:sensor histidine kinase [Cohnella sp. GCM10027633]|uniref:sensor histidine kinase n=1 Tax=unclassified Cohnella TaxID=2636738 RepID=UPI00362D1C55